MVKDTLITSESGENTMLVRDLQSILEDLPSGDLPIKQQGDRLPSLESYTAGTEEVLPIVDQTIVALLSKSQYWANPSEVWVVSEQYLAERALDNEPSGRIDFNIQMKTATRGRARSPHLVISAHIEDHALALAIGNRYKALHENAEVRIVEREPISLFWDGYVERREKKSL